MPYVAPETGSAAKRSLRAVDVLYDTGPEGWSVARLDWDGKLVLGIRWNGGEESGLGVPQSRGKPTWFVIPPELEPALLERVDELSMTQEGGLLDGYREMANDTEREAEALEWSEGLISDASSPER